MVLFYILNKDDRSKVIFGKKTHFLSKISLYLNTKCRDNLPFRRRSLSYGGTSKRGGFSEELILPYHSSGEMFGNGLQVPLAINMQ